MRILVTGGAGFIGSHLVETLLARGAQVAVLDSFDPYYPRATKERNLRAVRDHAGFGGLFEGDIRDRAFVRRVVAEVRPDAVAHLAARAGVRPSLEQPAEYCDVNLTGSAIVLDEAVRGGVERLLFASSSSVYGEKPRGPFLEDADCDRPLSPYGATKRAGELLCHAVHRASGLRVSCVRIFTAFGPRQRPDLAIHRFARMIEQGKPLPIYGDGSAERDFTFVADLVEGLGCALERADGFGVYNLGSGEPVTLEETIATLERVLGREAQRDYQAPRAGDVPRTWASIERARRDLGYAPRVGLEEGIRSFVQWLREEASCASS